MPENDSPNQEAQFHSKSHVHGLVERMAAAPTRIAPERAAQLKALAEKHHIQLQIKDQGETAFEMGAMFGQVFLSMRVLHHIWASALFFAALYIERHAAAEKGKAEVDMNTPEMEPIWANYLVSCKCLKENSDFPYPPNAKLITPREDYIQLADELFLGMAAFCLLHEIAHLESGDSRTDDTGSPLNSHIDPHGIEFAADKWAYDWILSRWNESTSDESVFVKRSLGVIFSLAMMDEFRHHIASDYVSSHPEACDRLLRFFKDYEAQIRTNQRGITCSAAAYAGLQVVAWSHNYLLPTEGFTDAISFLNLVKEKAPILEREAIERAATKPS